METQNNKLNEIIEGLAFQVTEEGKATLKKLIHFLRDFEIFIANQEVFQPIMIGMFQASAKVQGIDWLSLETAVEKIPTLNEIEEKQTENSSTESKDEVNSSENHNPNDKGN